MPDPTSRGRSRPSFVLKLTAALLVAVLVLVAFPAAYISYLVPDLFRQNRACQQEGYYMAEYEFKMLGFAYQLDRGQYAAAWQGIRRLHQQLKSGTGLVKVPAFTDKRKEFEFYLSLQNPRTGAFMDDSSPFCTYDGPTGNVLLHLEALAQDLGQPLRLKYPLKYLDQINTPEKLTAYLEDVSHVGWIATRFPTTSFHFARDLIDYADNDNVLERNHLYAFTPEWKHALLKWFYDFQDPESGLWGPRSRSKGQPVKLNPHNSTSIVKVFVDREGNDRYSEFPLRYKPRMFASTLVVMSRPLPPEKDLDEWHQWSLTMGRSADLLLRYLWKDASDEHKASARKLIAQYMRIRSERYFVPADGAFSYYPGSRHATLDGTSGALGLYFEVGAFSSERQQRLWGNFERTCESLGDPTLPALTINDLAPLVDRKDVNSIRIYAGIPGPADLATAAVAVYYPRPTPVFDAVELIPRVQRWLANAPQSMGNWVSRQVLSDRLLQTGIHPVPVFRDQLPLAALDKLLKDSKTITLIGFDVLQVPVSRTSFHIVGARQ